MNLLLDTCALLWLASGDKRLSAEARERVGSATIAYVSALSGFEIALKWRRRKLTLPASPEEWFSAALEHHALTAVPLVNEDAIRAPLLPDVHRDPCDRFIIACALRLGVPIVTVDPRFSAYGVSVIS
jgi:PIN domain nuclease of toxin-antitoxin system